MSKEVQKLRDYETALLRSYQAYLKTLLAAANAGPGGGGGKCKHGGGGAGGGSGAGSSNSALLGARVSVRCMGQLLVTHPHFNYTGDILQVCDILQAGVFAFDLVGLGQQRALRAPWRTAHGVPRSGGCSCRTSPQPLLAPSLQFPSPHAGACPPHGQPRRRHRQHCM